MRFEIRDEELAALELALEWATCAERVHALVELAWHLRQRDSMRALQLIAEAERRLAAHPLPADDARMLTARLSLAGCEISALYCRIEEGEAWLARARAHLLPTLDPHVEGDAWLAEATLAKATAQRSREIEAHERAMAFFADSPDRQRAGVARGRALCERCVSQSEQVPSSDALDVDPGPWPDGGPASEAWRLIVQAFPLCMREPAQAADLLMQAGQLARQMGMLRVSCVVMMNAGNAWLDLGDLDNAASCFDEAACQARKTGWPTLVGSSQIQVGRVLRHLGRHQDSLRVLNTALAQLRVAPPGITTAMACSELALTLTELGLDLEAIEVMNEAISFYRCINSHVNLALSLVRQVRALARIRDGKRALAAVDEARELIERHGYASLSAELSEALVAVHRRCKLPPPPEMTAPTAAIHFAQSALATGKTLPGWKPPPALLDSMADAWADADDMTQAYSYARLARTAHEQDDALRTKNPQALLHLLGYGNAPLPATARSVPRGPSHNDAPAAIELLTAKEAQILQLLARNYSNKEIAQALGIGAETVKWHLKSLYGKLGAGSRKHAVTRARTLGMLSFGA